MAPHLYSHPNARKRYELEAKASVAVLQSSRDSFVVPGSLTPRLQNVRGVANCFSWL